MSDSQIDRIMDALIDIRKNQQDISERLAKVEVMLDGLTDNIREMKRTLREHDERINDLETHKDVAIGAKDIFTWLAMAGIALWGVLK